MIYGSVVSGPIPSAEICFRHITTSEKFELENCAITRIAENKRLIMLQRDERFKIWFFDIEYIILSKMYDDLFLFTL